MSKESEKILKKTLKEKLYEANVMLETQKASYDYNSYMHGMYNGMEFIISIIEEREPMFLESPDVWSEDKSISAFPTKEDTNE